ncbi:MAG: carboxypeptidase-like regulatory domain-containing protein [Acidobacteriaceae bacterium]|nr:carboxypeptidase-like regulatory domain-containing protein [Acidobacteriaceae bacterium]
MIRAGAFVKVASGVLLGVVGLGTAFAQDKQVKEEHGRKWKPLPPLAHIVVTVEKGYNGHPISNAGVVFHAIRDGENDGNLEVKTNEDGRAVMDLVEVGSKVTIQVIASGFATYSDVMDVDMENKELLVKLKRPRAQISVYEDNSDKASQRQPGVQERVIPKVTPAPSSTTTPTAPATTAAPSTGTTTTPVTTPAASSGPNQ